VRFSEFGCSMWNKWGIFFARSRKNQCSKMAGKGCFSEKEGGMCEGGVRAVLGLFAGNCGWGNF
jgi:hypothetical protein